MHVTLIETLAYMAQHGEMALLCLVLGLSVLPGVIVTKNNESDWKKEHIRCRQAGILYRLPSYAPWVIISHTAGVLALTIFIIVIDAWLSTKFGWGFVQVAIGVALILPLAIANLWKLLIRGEWYRVQYQFREDMGR